IIPFQFLKVHYDSLSTWNPTTDYLRCNLNFNGHPRYDCVMVKTERKPFFVRLLYLFSCKMEQKLYGLVGFTPKPRKQSEFISVHSFISGAVLVPDFDKPNEFIVFDILYIDTSRRLKSLCPRDHEE
ncbi:hypothetical protein B0H14DRAFT_2358884, partial [Mycena olivaceomarginata]